MCNTQLQTEVCRFGIDPNTADKVSRINGRPLSEPTDLRTLIQPLTNFFITGGVLYCVKPKGATMSLTFNDGVDDREAQSLPYNSCGC